MGGVELRGGFVKDGLAPRKEDDGGGACFAEPLGDGVFDSLVAAADGDGLAGCGVGRVGGVDGGVDLLVVGLWLKKTFSGLRSRPLCRRMMIEGLGLTVWFVPLELMDVYSFHCSIAPFYNSHIVDLLRACGVRAEFKHY